jgi:hypothetical protein
MTDETTNEQNPENELPVFETGFMLLKAKDTGNWHVLTDITSPLRLEREVTINEVRVGSTEASHSISQQQLAALIITALSPQDPTTIEE